MRTLLLIVVVLVVLVIGAYLFLFRGSGGVDTLSPAAFVADHEPDALILDVRTAREYGSGHLEGAVNINVFAGDFRERVGDFDRERSVYLYCGSGQRSGRATAILNELGFRRAVNVGGYGDLKAAGARVVEP